MGSAAKDVQSAFENIETTIVDGANYVEDGLIDGANIIKDQTIEFAGEVARGASSAFDWASQLVDNVETRTRVIVSTIEKSTEELAKMGIDVYNQEYKILSEKIKTLTIEGVQFLEDCYDMAGDWVDQNACQIGVTSALSAAIVFSLTPAQPEGAVLSTELSFLAQPVLYSKDMAQKMAVAKLIATPVALIFNEIWFIKGNIDVNLLTNVISNCIYHSLDNCQLWLTPAGVGIAIGSAVSPVIAFMACNRTIPKGFDKIPDFLS